MQIKAGEWKGRNNTKKKVTVQKAAETGKQGALSGAIFVCCSDSPQIKEDRSVRVKRRRDGEERGRQDRIDGNLQLSASVFQFKVFRVKRLLNTHWGFWVGGLIVDSENARARTHTNTHTHRHLQDTPDSTWSTAVFLYCHHVIPAVYWKPCQLKPKGSDEDTPAHQMNSPHVSLQTQLLWDRVEGETSCFMKFMVAPSPLFITFFFLSNTKLC